mgnify:FL=1
MKKKNKIKLSDNQLATAIEKLEFYNKSKSSLLKRRKSLKTQIKRVTNDIAIIDNKVNDLFSQNPLAFNKPPVVSIGHDKRSATYICIIKFKQKALSFYLGNEVKIKNDLQQFYKYNLKPKGMNFVKSELKTIISKIIYNFISTDSELSIKKGKKLNFKNIIQSYSDSGLWDFWKAV